MRYYFLALFCLLLLTGCESGFYAGPNSDHYNGCVFFNPVKYCFKPITSVPQPNRCCHRSYHVHPIKVTFINHATVLMQSRHVNLLADPVWSDRASPCTWCGPERLRLPGIPFADLPPIDAVLISHNHYDHMDIATLIKLKKRFDPIFIVPLGNKTYLNIFGICKVIELDWWQQCKVGPATITFLPSRHWSSRWFSDIDQTLWGSYGIELYGKKIYFAGDTAYSNHFKAIRSKWGTPDLSLLPIGAYKPRYWLQSAHVDPAEAVQAHQDLGSHVSIGIHFGTFALSLESISEPVDDLLEVLACKNGGNKRFFVLSEGESWLL